MDAEPAMNGAIDDSWSKAAALTLDTDFTNRRPATEITGVRLARDGDALDVAFDARQSESLIASQQTNSSAVLNDDYVGIYLWPQGVNGFQYSFVANPRGARYQTSSENSAFSPQWTAVAKTVEGGYVVTMRIPLGVIRGGGSNTWRVQFVRQVVATNNLDLWAYSPSQQNAAMAAYAGMVTNFASRAAARPSPRLQVYALGDLTTPRFGGNTSRTGADLSLPVTPTSSLVAAIHPDYSNVEIDQQTIAPSAYAYQYQEVRPFFTQLQQPFNYTFSCTNCPTLLYTPAIPTIRDAYAYEGTQGPTSFAAFDAVGKGRTDQAQVVDYKLADQNRIFTASYQRGAVDDRFADIHETNDSFFTGYENRRTHFFVYGNASLDRGSAVTSPGDAGYLALGGGYVDALTVYGADYQYIGPQFNPVDGFVAQNDINGYDVFYHHTYNFKPNAVLHDVFLSTFGAEFHNKAHERSQEDENVQVNFDFKNLATVRVYLSEFAVRTFADEFLPFDTNGFIAGYRYATATPTYVSFNGGPYYHGKLDSWTYVTTLQAAPRVHLRLETDEDAYLSSYPGERRTNYWLDRASLDWQLSRDASFALGARRILGIAAPNSFVPVSLTPVSAGNVSLAFHLLQQKNEFFVVYGDSNSLATTPALFIKWIHYFGAPKGT